MMVALVFAATVLVDPAFCSASGPAQARWTSDGRGSLWASTDGPLTGDVVLRCRVRLAQPASAITIAWDHALIRFTPSSPKTTGDGVRVRVGGRCEIPLVRVTGEDWIETPAREAFIELSVPARTVEFELRLIDRSREVSVRADVLNLRIMTSRTNVAEVCPHRSDKM